MGKWITMLTGGAKRRQPDSEEAVSHEHVQHEWEEQNEIENSRLVILLMIFENFANHSLTARNTVTTLQE